eukprot:4734893-Prymnesium_polylepis.1
MRSRVAWDRRQARGGALSRMTATGAQSAWAMRTARNMRNIIANALGWSSDSVAGGSVATLGIFASSEDQQLRRTAEAHCTIGLQQHG